MKRIMVDMSVTLLHEGHIRLLQKAKSLDGHVVVALTTDEEVQKNKGYKPELTFEQRKEILLSLESVDEVVPCSWMVTQDFLKQHNIDVFVHAGPNFNQVTEVHSFDRTEGVSSSDVRDRAVTAL